METVRFSLDGVGYEIAVTTVQAEQLRNAFGQWTTHAREVGRSTQAANRDGQQDIRGPQSKAIRAWARSRGYRVSERGRIASTLVAAYREEHSR
ncbi:Lsr2 family protein [Nocardia gamkensis]|uniref:Lsr2 family protein n=1 Tax=Nocardia gamkensis TaxID=352869 RepID=A0A7X6L4W5_9NOCA|nr:Lsr2 family protein [Nocardia gamkensis]NKY27752.1 Lsr2 family protein [Nocardia gamkensis]